MNLNPMASISFLTLAILFQTPVIAFFDKYSFGLLSRLCIPVMIFFHIIDVSVLSLHYHFTNKATLRALIDPTPNPSFSLGPITFSHET